MPSIAAHMAVAKLVSEKLNINDPVFIKGNLLPDIINSNDSHHKIHGKYFLIPDISYFKDKLDLKNKLYLGYYTHLLLDKYFLEDYLPKYTKDINNFSNGIIYKEYDLINYKIVKDFNLDVDYLSTILSDYEIEVKNNILEDNIKFLNSKNEGKTKYINPDITEFIKEVSDKIVDDINDLGVI